MKSRNICIHAATKPTPHLIRPMCYVLRGAESDLVWLHRDLLPYLPLPRRFLAHLDEGLLCYLRRTVTSIQTSDINSQIGEFDHYQMRLMLQHVRANAEFPLHIYDNLRNVVLDLAISRTAFLQVVPVPL